MKTLRQFIAEAHNESQAKAEQYISYDREAKGKRMDGTTMHHRGDHIVIHQHVDGEEEADKYIVHKKHVKPAHWKKLESIAAKHKDKMPSGVDFWKMK